MVHKRRKVRCKRNSSKNKNNNEENQDFRPRQTYKVEEGIRDISLQDFADNSRTTPRLKKSLLIVNKQKRHLAPSNAILEKPVDILEDFPHEEEEEEVENRIVSEDPTPPITMASQSSPSHQHNSTPTVQFPPEIWVLLSHYILPEDVASFGAVCRDSYAVVNSPSFWLKLYKDFYAIDRARTGVRVHGNEVTSLPHDLTSPFDVTGSSYRTSQEILLRGLKSKVIRLLYYRYKPFINRLVGPAANIPYPHKLEGLHLQEISSTRVASADGKNSYKFRLKFGHMTRTPDTLWRRMYPPRPPSENEYVDSTRGNDEGQIEARDDWEKAYSSDDDDDCDRSSSYVDPNVIFDSPDRDGWIMTAETASMNLVEHEGLGKLLHQTALTVSGQSFQYRKLQMTFVPYKLRSTQTTSDMATVVINDIVRLKMVPWYHPSYSKV